MIRNRTLVRCTAVVTTTAMLALAMPAWAFAPDFKGRPATSKGKESRELSIKEMAELKGRWGENPYVSGVQRSSIVMSGVDLLTMNYTTSATDLSFEGGYGVPINVTRTYSANEADEGPFGKGWVLSADIRSTAGGLLKSDKSGDRSNPVHIKQFPFSQQASDSSFANSERIAITDASGRETESKLDVDGILSGPLWDKNIYNSVYEDITLGDYTYTILASMTVETPEGTVYEYSKQGAYANGTTGAMNAVDFSGVTQPSNPPQTPSNILKISTITDRHGNQTSFTYTTAESSRGYYTKLNGVAWENCLSSISMPGGRTITFTWTTTHADEFGSGKHMKRVTQVSDGVRDVTYTYNSSDPVSNVETVTSPEGYATSFTYANADYTDGSNGWWQSQFGQSSNARNLLHTITDARGLTTTIDYAMGTPAIPGTTFCLPTACAYRVTHPNGVKLYVWNWHFYQANEGEAVSGGYLEDYPDFVEDDEITGQFLVGTTDNPSTAIGHGLVQTELYTIANPPYMLVRMKDQVTPNGGGNPGSTGSAWEKKYNLVTGDCFWEKAYIYPYHNDDLTGKHGLYDSSVFSSQTVTVDTTHNFQGNPLTKTVTESTDAGNPKVIEYAYHGYDRYFLQKAVKDPAGRISYTDYYDRSATDGKKGQVYRVYDPKWSNGFSNSSGTGWKDNVAPSNADLWSAQFDYDTDGRPTEVQKLKSGTVGSSGTYVRVKTVTTYGGTGTPFWGAAATVTEDSGSGKINRQTQTLAYDIAGRAIETYDAAQRYWYTTYDDDGRIQAVEWRTNPTGTSNPVAQYTYGTTGMEKGMPIEVRDQTAGLTSEIIQTISYVSSGGGKGQVSQVSEDRENNTSDYAVTYTYTGNGERDTVLYDTPNGQRKWRYGGYRGVGSPEGVGRAFTELIAQEYVGSAWQDGSDQMLYHYDTAGRLMFAAFACTKNTDWTGWPDNGTNPGYYVANSRALQTNHYDAAGRVEFVANEWQSGMSYSGTTGGPVYSSKAAIPDGLVGYDYSSSTGLRSNLQHFTNSGTGWATTPYRTEYYGYDSSLDYLTNVDYNDGGANEYQTWQYDAAGNRTYDSAKTDGSWVYDNLNRMTNSPKLGTGGGDFTGWVYQHDILGNRTGRNMQEWSTAPARYDWDCLNRALLIASSTGGSTHVYRADGQRVEKVDGVTVAWTGSKRSGHYDTNYTQNGPSTRYFYDGQMGIEDDYNPSGTITVINRYAMGARGIDRIERYENSATTYGYPLYDGHGNMRAVLAKNGSSYTTGNWRTYDVWGGLRTGGSSSDPKQGYCASIRHVADVESGLIYMRARYHEPATGRFLSEDPARHRSNWTIYCSNDPVNRLDPSGRTDLGDVLTTDAINAGLEAGYNIKLAAWLENGVMRIGVDFITRVNPQVAGSVSVFITAINQIAQRNSAFAVRLYGYVQTSDGARWIERVAAQADAEMSKDQFWTVLYWLVRGSQ